MTGISVLVVEDDSFTRSTLCSALQHEAFETPGTAKNAVQGLESYKKFQHQALLADLDLGPGPTGVELAWQIRQINPKLGVVLLTSYEDPRLHRRSQSDLPPGARYLVKQELANLQQISTALREVLTSSIAAPFEITPSALSVLSDTQVETLRLIAQGLTNAELAKTRFVTEKAVEQTITKIGEALQLETTGKNLRVVLANTYLKHTGGKL